MKASNDKITIRYFGKLDPIRQHRAKMLVLMTLNHVRRGVCVIAGKTDHMAMKYTIRKKYLTCKNQNGSV